jgi:aspartyl-tRNA synthetase
MKKVNREHIMNTTTPDERSEKDGLAREPRELSSEELESIIGGVEVGSGVKKILEKMPKFYDFYDDSK